MPKKALKVFKRLSRSQAAILIKLSKFPNYTAYISHWAVRERLETKGYTTRATRERSTLTEAGLEYTRTGRQVGDP